MTKKFFLSSALLLATGLGAYLVIPKPSSQQFELVIVQARTITQNALAIGHIVPSHAISVKSQISGILGEVYVSVGQSVEAGQPLIKIQPNPTPQALTDAITLLSKSEATLAANQQN